jgi:hypothetical protein
MSHTDINKWISGETEIFDPRHIPPQSGDSNGQKKDVQVWPTFWGYVQTGVAIVFGLFGIFTLVCLLILSRYSVDPFAAATTAKHLDGARASVGGNRRDAPSPDRPEDRTLLSGAGLTAFLRDRIDPSPSASAASAPLPPRGPVTRLALPETPSIAEQEDAAWTYPEPLAREQGAGSPDHALSADGSSRPRSAKPRPSRSDSVARLPMLEASPLTERANAFINSYWQKVGDSGDQVLPYLSSIYAPMVVYYGKSLPKQAVLRDKYYFVKRWPIRQTQASSGAENRTISCNEAAAECEISGFRQFKAVSAERGARATGVVRYRYAVRFSEASPQIVVEDSKIVAHN